MLYTIIPINAIMSFCLQVVLAVGVFYLSFRILWSRHFRMSHDEFAALKPSDMRRWPHWVLVIYTAGFGFAIVASSAMGRVLEAAHSGVLDRMLWYVLGAAIPILVVMVPIGLIVRWASRRPGPKA